jgi:hypothetical protein
LPDVRCAEARRAEIESPEGVVRSFHVSLYKVDPTEAVFACNLFSKDRWRSALFDEVKPVRPEVPLVSHPFSRACTAERLARTRSRPDWSVVFPSCGAERMAPDPDPCEEVTLSKFKKLFWFDIRYTPFIDHTIGNVTISN